MYIYIYTYIYICTYVYQFESHLTMRLIDKNSFKGFKDTFILSSILLSLQKLRQFNKI